MLSARWTVVLSDFLNQIIIPDLAVFLKALFVLIVLPIPLFLFFGLRFYHIPRRLWMKKFRSKEEIEKLQELLAISRQYSEITEIREWILERISPRLSFKNPVEYFESPPSGMNRAQFIENLFYKKRKELKKIFSEKEIKAFS